MSERREDPGRAQEPSALSSAVQESGGLTLVPVPIGNLEDITLRALRALREASSVLCEDTRRTRQLFSLLGLAAPPLQALHEHNEGRRVEALIRRMEAGEALVLVSDAGTPAISDPGFPLVRATVAAGLPVSALPGPCALIPALAASGLPSDAFSFHGFPPSKGGARRRFYGGLKDRRETLIFYEGPHRLFASLEDAQGAFGGDRPAVIARELSKRFESFHRGTLSELLERPGIARGEVVLLIGGAPPSKASDDEVGAALRAALDEGLSPSQAARVVAKQSGRSRKELYQLLLSAGAAEDRSSDEG